MARHPHQAVDKYLQNYAEPAFELESFPGDYRHLLAIPAFDESPTLIDRLRELPSTDSVLVILVVNAPDNLKNPRAIHNTRALAETVKNSLPPLWSPNGADGDSHSVGHSVANEDSHLYQLSANPRHHLLMVERCHPGRLIPGNQGVGLARKIACDLACRLIRSGKITSPWIHSCDADVLLPPGYFGVDEAYPGDEFAALLYPFQHLADETSEPALQKAQNLYDISLHYYVAGLSWAGSPYAFHTIGSTMAIHYRHYASARGFPKRAAGEDFYLLNKLAKSGRIISLKTPCLHITLRASERVPFGTGPALTKILQLDAPLEDYLYYNPLCFHYLKAFLDCLPRLWKQRQTSIPENLKLALKAAGQCQQEILLDVCDGLAVAQGLGHAFEHSKNHETFVRHVHNWFDAFKTLKFIHYLRDRHFPSLPLSDTIKEAGFLKNSPEIVSSDLFKKTRQASAKSIR